MVMNNRSWCWLISFQSSACCFDFVTTVLKIRALDIMGEALFRLVGMVVGVRCLDHRMKVEIVVDCGCWRWWITYEFDKQSAIWQLARKRTKEDEKESETESERRDQIFLFSFRTCAFSTVC